MTKNLTVGKPAFRPKFGVDFEYLYAQGINSKNIRVVCFAQVERDHLAPVSVGVTQSRLNR